MTELPEVETEAEVTWETVVALGGRLAEKEGFVGRGRDEVDTEAETKTETETGTEVKRDEPEMIERNSSSLIEKDTDVVLKICELFHENLFWRKMD